VAEVVKTIHLCFDEFASDTLEGMPGDRKVIQIENYAELRMVRDDIKRDKTVGAVCLDGLTQAIQNHRADMSGSTADKYVDGNIPLWTRTKNLWRMTIADFAHLPVHVLLACISRTEDDVRLVAQRGGGGDPERGEIKRVVPNLETNLRHEIGGYLNGKGYMWKESNGRLLTHHLSFYLPNIDTKLCHPTITIKDMVDPTFEKVWKRITEKESK